jgi:hypothetical protein
MDANYPTISGTYYGGGIGTISGCPSNNGPISAVDTYYISVNGAGVMTISEASTACQIKGQIYYYMDGGDLALQGATVACSNGMSATVDVPHIYVTPIGLTFEYTEQLGGTCKSVGRGGGFR